MSKAAVMLPSISAVSAAVARSMTRTRSAAPCVLLAEREEPFPARDGRQVLFLLCCAPAQQEGGAPEQHGRQHRLRHEPAAELLHDHHELHVAEPETVVLHRENDAEPAKAGHLRPECTGKALRIAVVAQPADALQRRAARDELADRLLEELLLGSEDAIHGGPVREAKHALGDDVQLDLRRPALDRVAPRAEPVA